MTATKRTDNFLREHELRLTNCRRDVLNLFFDEPYALSQALFEENLSNKYDRVTIYRTLKSFLDAGIIHKVLDDRGIIKYALCPEACNSGHHHDHVHFKCKKCGKTICLEKIEIPDIRLPDYFDPDEVSVLVTGVCDQCGK